MGLVHERLVLVYAFGRYIITRCYLDDERLGHFCDCTRFLSNVFYFASYTFIVNFSWKKTTYKILHEFDRIIDQENFIRKEDFSAYVSIWYKVFGLVIWYSLDIGITFFLQCYIRTFGEPGNNHQFYWIIID